MTVFYSIYDERGTRDYCFTQYLGNLLLETDISYWIVPGTINDMDELEDIFI
jgi:hypothetical protein